MLTRNDPHTTHMFRLKTTTVDLFISMLIPKRNFSTWYLEYRGVNAGNRVSDTNIETRELHPLNNNI